MIDRPKDEAEIIRIGEEAVRAVRQTFERWMDVARALEIGRHWAMVRAGTNHPAGRGYAQAFNQWLELHPIFAGIKGSTRSWLYRCYENRHEITKWREEQGNHEIAKYAYPETVFKRWQKAIQPVATIADSERDEKPPTLTRRRIARIAELEQELRVERHEKETLFYALEEAQTKIKELEEELVWRIDPVNDSVKEMAERIAEHVDSAAFLKVFKAAANLQSPQQEHSETKIIPVDELKARNAPADRVDAETSSGRPGRRGKYQFGKMAIGETILATGKSQPAVSSAAVRFGARHGMTFKTKQVVGGVEVTRAA